MAFSRAPATHGRARRRFRSSPHARLHQRQRPRGGGQALPADGAGCHWSRGGALLPRQHVGRRAIGAILRVAATLPRAAGAPLTYSFPTSDLSLPTVLPSFPTKCFSLSHGCRVAATRCSRYTSEPTSLATPDSRPSPALMKLSRSVSRAIRSSSCPVCSAKRTLSFFRIFIFINQASSKFHI